MDGVGVRKYIRMYIEMRDEEAGMTIPMVMLAMSRKWMPGFAAVALGGR